MKTVSGTRVVSRAYDDLNRLLMVTNEFGASVARTVSDQAKRREMLDGFMVVILHC